jgi:hypothetical protein
MKTEIIFRGIDEVISYVECIKNDLFETTFDTLKIIEDELPFFFLKDVEAWAEGKSTSLFQSAHSINRKVQKSFDSYVQFIKPAPPGSYTPVGIDVGDV